MGHSSHLGSARERQGNRFPLLSCRSPLTEHASRERRARSCNSICLRVEPDAYRTNSSPPPPPPPRVNKGRDVAKRCFHLLTSPSLAKRRAAPLPGRARVAQHFCRSNRAPTQREKKPGQNNGRRLTQKNAVPPRCLLFGRSRQRGASNFSLRSPFFSLDFFL